MDDLLHKMSECNKDWEELSEIEQKLIGVKDYFFFGGLEYMKDKINEKE